MTDLASQPPSGPVALIFGADDRFQLQAAERRLLVDGRPASIGARALDLLITLAAQPDHLITKGELLDRVWAGLVVEEANLHVQISALRKLLGGDVIATVPGRGYRFAAPLRARPQPPASTPPAPALPVGPKLIGRDVDLARLEAALQGGAIVTLAGTSGVGKTSLARLAFQRWSGRRAWADLASIVAGQAVEDAVARALGAPLVDGEVVPQLLRAAGSEPLLLVLDNAEHLVDACAALVMALRPLPQLRLLITSQMPLALGGEQVQRLEPLALAAPSATLPAQPADAALAIEQLGQGALALLVSRIVAVDHRFRVTAEGWPLLNGICAQLDGLPLALEMAASRVPTLGLKGVHEALAQRFALLTRGHRDAAERHRTLHDAIDWSYRLLDPAAQRLWRALGVFVDGFTLDLAVALHLGPGHGAVDDEARWDVIDTLARLVDRSLVAVSADDPPRYRLLDTLRAFAREQTRLASAPGETWNDVQRGLALALLELLGARPLGTNVADAPYIRELANVRTAMDWAVGAGELAIAADLSTHATGVSTFSTWRHTASQWLTALEPAMRQAPEGAIPPSLAARWWGELARMWIINGDERAPVAAEQAYTRRQALGDSDDTLHAACVWLRSLAASGPEMDRALAAVDAAALAAPTPSPRRALLWRSSLAFAAGKRGDMHESLRQHEAELMIAEAQGWDRLSEVAESNVIGRLAHVGRVDEAIERGSAMLARLADDNGNLPWVLLIILDGLIDLGRAQEGTALAPRAWQAFLRFNVPGLLPRLARLAVLQQRAEDAARLLGYASQAVALRGLTPVPEELASFDATTQLLHDALGSTRAKLLEREGRLLSDDAARVLLLGA